ncbi:MAG: tryptophan synthase subunit beta [Candidatus Omnitrophica bacterium]|nr:tryptophan synthase subunit beta [Candidatus Omnitrophota bacterium]
MKLPDKRGYYGSFGGKFVPETLSFCLNELESAYRTALKDKQFKKKVSALLIEYANRPTPLYYAEKLSSKFGMRIYLKREDLLHTGAHKINNALAQAMLAKFMKKPRIIAETGAGQHGVAVATAAGLLGFKCDIYMGAADVSRQSMNVFRMKVLGANVISVNTGSKTLKDACNQAIRDWVSSVDNTYYLIGSTIGPHPYPEMVRNFQSVIGIEARKQILQIRGRLPDFLVACVGGGSNAIGLFYPFYKDSKVKFIGVEAAGLGLMSDNSASLAKGRVGVFQGAKSFLLQDCFGQVKEAHSVAPGLDYPGVGPEHSFYKETKRAEYVTIDDKEALWGFKTLSEIEGIIPALESSHAIAYLKRLAPLNRGKTVIVCLSGRGDKDLNIVMEQLGDK